jgi:peptidoglycan/LPS O-acetylase OafA/YrhL
LLSFFKIIDQKNSIAALDGVRAIACFTVIFYHINLVTTDPNIHIWKSDMIGPIAAGVAFAGWCGVTLFFVLSGFLLFMPYARALLFDTEWPGWRHYYLRRVFRIWPGYFVSLWLMLVWLHPNYFRPEHRFDLVLFLTFLMDSTPQTYQAINGPFWTLAIEWQFYVILPLLALVFGPLVRRGSLRRRLWMLSLCLGGVALWGVLTRAWGLNWVTNPHQPLLLPQVVHDVAFLLFYGQNGKFLEDFAVGMFISVCYVLYRERGYESGIVLALRRYSGWFWGIGILWLFMMGIWSALPPVQALLEPWMGDRRMFSDFRYALGYGSCIIAVLFGPAHFRRPLEWRPLRCLGQLTYGIYMWHLPLLLWFIPTMTALAQHRSPIFAYGLYWACIVCIVLPFCYCFFLLIERPGINLGAKLLKGKARRSPAKIYVLVEKEASVEKDLSKEENLLYQMQEK